MNIPLNFNWKYTPTFKEEYIKNDYLDEHFESVSIPHTNIELPLSNFNEEMYQFESTYRKKLWIEKIDEDTEVYLHFKAVMSYAKVYLNEIYIGEHKGGYTPFRLNITKAIIENAHNNLVVIVDSNEREDIPPFGFVIDYLTYGGIYREVSLEYRHKIHIEHLQVTPLNLKGDVEVKLHFNKETNCPLTLKYHLIKDEKIIQSFIHDNTQKSLIPQNLKFDGIKLWSLENPELYHLKVEIIHQDKKIDTQSVRFGFRTFRFEEEGFYLNNEKIKIRGLNRHQSYPYVGYAMPKSAQQKDADILKNELGVNAVRLSHYPQSDHFLDRCDEIGLLVFDEIPGWQHIGDEAWQEIAIQNVKEMILKDHNHPSVMLWGTRINESQDSDDFYSKTHALAKSLDTSRPTGGVRDFENSNIIEDIYTFNDFVHSGKNQGLRKKKSVTKTHKPYMVTEHNGHMFPTKKYDHESKRIEHTLRHLTVLNDLYENDDILGSFGWCMFDYNTHKDFGSGDRVCHHGVMDMFRIPKYASYAYQSQSNTKPMMHVASSMNIGEYEGSLLEDIHIFTNCDAVKLYKNNQYIKTFYPDTSQYKHLKNPLIIIDDLVGDAILENENFSKKDAEIIKELLIKASKQGTDLPLFDQLRMLRLFIKYKMNMSHAEALYTKYFGGWGQKATEYTFKGFIAEKHVETITKSQIESVHLSVKVDETHLIEDETYDVTRVTVHLKDQNDNDVSYAFDPISIETEGPIELIGPKTLALTGGSTGFWIKTISKEGEAKLTITSPRFEPIIKDIKVTKVHQSQ